MAVSPAHGLVLAVSLMVGCQCGQDVVEPVTEPVERTVTNDASAVLVDHASVRVDPVRWAWQDQEGWVWRARLPRTAALDIRPSNTVADLLELAPDDDGAPFALLNGGFYEDGPMGLVVSDGIEHHALTERGGSGILFHDGTHAQVIHRDDWQGQGQQALQSIDRLVVDGQSVVTQNDAARLAARSAVVLDDEWVWLVIQAADASIGANQGTEVQISAPYDHGMPLWAFAEWLVTDMHAQFALNMDGGLSTNLMVRTDAGNFDLTGVDGTINGVLFRP